MSTTTRPLLGIFLLAFAVRVAWVLTLGPSMPWDDEREFAMVARHLAAGDGFVSTSFRANPMLPAYLGLVFHLFGESATVARIGQAAMGAFTCVLIAMIARRILGATVGVLSAVLLALYPPHIYLSGVFYVECLFTLLITATVYCAVRLVDASRVTWWTVLTGATLGIAALTRSVIIAYLPFLVTALLYASWPRWRQTLRSCAILVVAFVATVTPWALRNRAVYGQTIIVSSGLGTKLWQGNNEMTAGDADDRELYWNTKTWNERASTLDDASRRELDARYEEISARIVALQSQLGDRYLATDAVLMPIALKYIAANPGRTMVLFLKKVGTLFAPFSKTITTNQYTTTFYRIVAGISSLPLLIFAAVGAWLGLREDKRLMLVYALLGSVISAYGLLNTCTRFRLPLDPFLIILAALALVRSWQLVTSARPAASVSARPSPSRA